MIISAILNEATQGQILINFALFLTLIYGIVPTSRGPLTSQRFDKKYPQLLYFYGIALLILSVFGYSDWDYWGYKSIVTRIIQTKREIHVEPVYTWLALTLKNYIIWRLAIWSIAVIFMLKTVKKLPVNKTTTLFFITIIYVLHFYKLRNALGFSLIYWGLTLLCLSKGSIVKQLFGLAFIVSSYFFHGSMIFTILLLSVCFIRLNKLRISILLILWPFLVSATSILIHNVANGTFVLNNDSMDIAQKAAHYANDQGLKGTTLFGLLRTVLDNLAIIFSLLYMTKRFVYDKIQSPKIIQYFYQIWFAASYISYLFAFQESSTWIFIRINTMGFFPMAIVLGWYFGTYKRNKPQRAIIMLCTLSFMYSIFYLVYKSF
ncbi:MAG: hypothetical protein HDR82_01265 [Bacteroides sp.]|nr:hypothetical protein [Bacteroides sp.]